MIPAYERARWGENHTLLNDTDLPLWSGKGEPPAIGSEVELTGRRDGQGNRFRAKITHYEVSDKWLMACGYRLDGDRKRGNLAGAEIYYPADAEA